MKANYSKKPVVSVIIPTHNRSASLQRTLDGLRFQTYPLQQIEVLVVADGCTDNTVEMLHYYEAPFVLRPIEQSGQGAAAARNRGVARASGQLLLFLDDDVEPTPTLVEAHICAHRREPGQVVIGPYPPAGQKSPGFFHIQLRAWWEHKFSDLSQPGHRFIYRDLLSGNFSLDANLFSQIGGFDSTIRDCGGEDYEFGVRLIKANVVFSFAAGAVGYHYMHETTDLNRMFQRARQEGSADVVIGQRHPELRSELPIAGIKSFRLLLRIILQLVIFGWPAMGDFLIGYFQQALDLLERVGLRFYWQRLYGSLHLYWYWRGVADKLGARQALMSFLKDDRACLNDQVYPIDLDLSQGLVTAEHRLDEERPMAVRMYYGKQPVALIPAPLGAERLRGHHLRPMLANVLAVPLLEALALEEAIVTSGHIDRGKLFESIRSKSTWFGPTDIGKMWFEQYSQWNHLEKRDRNEEYRSGKNWESIRKLEYETVWLRQQPNRTNWRIRVYLTLYRWHQPYYHWCTNRGWMWPVLFRERIKQMLLRQAKA